jgi:CRISPR/Cas system CMR-associated protein Cmr5 small subunit
MSTEEPGGRPHEQAARSSLAEVRQTRVQMQNYKSTVRSLPSLLQRHGLGQTLAYLQVRGGGNANSAFDLVLRQLDRWLLAATGAPGRTALAALATRDSRFYREASEQAWLFVRSLSAQVEEAR